MKFEPSVHLVILSESFYRMLFLSTKESRGKEAVIVSCLIWVMLKIGKDGCQVFSIVIGCHFGNKIGRKA
ncbi:hypothetical protein CIPAW_07G152700 [Carya illinoinensis]|uniref:Uncharacterized protein n=1 Tax=Carya illinoinensis TaxID=32201 RepID=A0A8T1PZF4_CARIL|nr:hypothetical protein CIPAW_07G152700 [Carya illinoinensis]